MTQLLLVASIMPGQGGRGGWPVPPDTGQPAGGHGLDRGPGLLGHRTAAGPDLRAAGAGLHILMAILLRASLYPIFMDA